MQKEEHVSLKESNLINGNSHKALVKVSNPSLSLSHSPPLILLNLCLLCVGYGMSVIGFLGAVIPEIERQFGFTSAQSGSIPSFQDLGYWLVSLLVGYAGRRCTVKLLGTGGLLMCLGSLMFSLPYFISLRYNPVISKSDPRCYPLQPNASMVAAAGAAVDCQPQRNLVQYSIFCIAFLFLGFGSSPLYITGPTLIHRIAQDKDNTGLYLGIFYFFTVTGPAVGFITAKPFLNTYVDLSPPPGLDAFSPSWVGAWWMCYLACAIFLILVSIPMLCFFESPPPPPRCQGTVSSRTASSSKRFCASVGQLLRNRSFMLQTAAVTINQLSIAGFGTFMPKFLEVNYQVSTSTASILSGVMVCLGGAAGAFCGGYLIKRFMWNCRQTLLFAAAISTVIALLTPCCMVGCEEYTYQGLSALQHGIRNTDPEVRKWIQQPCNQICNCSHHDLMPVCHLESGRNFYSPCTLGCTHSSIVERKLHYSNCSCLGSTESSVVVEGLCPKSCNQLYLFITLGFLFMFSIFLIYAPLTETTMKTVRSDQVSMAIGVQQFIMRLLGPIPGPVIFGALIDHSCKLWEVEKCNPTQSHCLQYNSKNFRFYITILCTPLGVLSAICVFLAWKLYVDPEQHPSVKLDAPEKTELLEVHTLP